MVLELAPIVCCQALHKDNIETFIHWQIVLSTFNLDFNELAKQYNTLMLIKLSLRMDTHEHSELNGELWSVIEVPFTQNWNST